MTVAFVEKAIVPRDWNARRLHREYAEAAKKNPHSYEYRQLEKLYQQLKMNRRVLSLSNAMRFSGCHADGKPVLAIAAAHAKWCYFVPDAGRLHDRDQSWSHPSVAFVSEFDVNPGRRIRNYNSNDSFKFPRDMFTPTISREIRAQVPIVPPKCLPKGALSNYFILWEANWEVAPLDPYLLRRITSDLFVVMAQWDLTPAERAVMQAAIVSR